MDANLPRLIIDKEINLNPNFMETQMDVSTSAFVYPTPNSAHLHSTAPNVVQQKQQRAILKINPSLGLVVQAKTTANMSRFIAYLFKNIISRIPMQNSNATHMLHNTPPNHADLLFKALLQSFSIELPVLILALFYLNRLCEQSAQLQTMNSERKIVLFCVCIGLAIKFTDDKATRSERWTRIINVQRSEANNAERFVLEEIGYSLYVDVAEYATYCGVIRGLAKLWNTIALSPSPFNNSPTCATPITPFVRIPSLLRDIQQRVGKRSAEDEDSYAQLETPVGNSFGFAKLRKSPLSAGLTKTFPRYAHAIFDEE